MNKKLKQGFIGFNLFAEPEQEPEAGEAAGEDICQPEW